MSDNLDEAIKAEQLTKLKLENLSIANQKWDSRITKFIPVITALIAVVGFWFGVYQYFSQQKQINEQRQREALEASNRQENELRRANEVKEQDFRRRFWEEQISIYKKVCDLAARIALAENPNQVKKERNEFWVLYWGELSIIEDSNVNQAMVVYGNDLRGFENGWTTSASLKQKSYLLARACRNSLKRTWEPAPVDDIPDMKTSN